MKIFKLDEVLSSDDIKHFVHPQTVVGNQDLGFRVFWDNRFDFNDLTISGETLYYRELEWNVDNDMSVFSVTERFLDEEVTQDLLTIKTADLYASLSLVGVVAEDAVGMLTDRIYGLIHDKTRNVPSEKMNVWEGFVNSLFTDFSQEMRKVSYEVLSLKVAHSLMECLFVKRDNLLAVRDSMRQALRIVLYMNVYNDLSDVASGFTVAPFVAQRARTADECHRMIKEIVINVGDYSDKTAEIIDVEPLATLYALLDRMVELTESSEVYEREWTPIKFNM